jgi:hypothetical protein
MILRQKPINSGSTKLLSQEMIIKKLTYYYSLNKEYTDLIPKIESGICEALSRLFIEHKENNDWDKMLNEIQQWDETSESLLKNLHPIFEEITKAVHKYYCTPDTSTYYYIGDNFFTWLFKQTQPIILQSLWHFIAITPITKNKVNSWAFYDPNCTTGTKYINSQDLLISKIKESLNNVYLVDNQLIKNEPVEIKNCDNFIARGGLLVLCKVNNSNEIIEILKKKPVENLTDKALKGLFVTDNKNIPAWAIAICCNSYNSGNLSHYCITLIEEFIRRNNDYHKQFQNSIDNKEISTELRQRFTKKLSGVAPESPQPCTDSPLEQPSPLSTEHPQTSSLIHKKPSFTATRSIKNGSFIWKVKAKPAANMDSMQKTLSPSSQSKQKMIWVVKK